MVVYFGLYVVGTSLPVREKLGGKRVVLNVLEGFEKQ
jgi:hypothetical protein